ncbi:MAG TPA: MazG nucleotide pyrophosphohydrolase domain-containing protein [Chitinophagales bacterium]|nr:MazG nucleotide pyrophosphohydrolase domain-containing protein [Chitinophagales bacterium]
MPHLAPNPTLAQLQQFIKELCAEKGWDKNSHLEIFLLFSEEIGELAKAIRKHTQLYTETNATQPDKFELEEEFADVLNYLLDLANFFNVDLEEAFRKKNRLNQQRTWE